MTVVRGFLVASWVRCDHAMLQSLGQMLVDERHCFVQPMNVVLAWGYKHNLAVFENLLLCGAVVHRGCCCAMDRLAPIVLMKEDGVVHA